jgi:ATP-dependent DNA helicase RecG
MRSLSEILALLDRLDECVADDLEAQDLDFKRWIDRSLKDALAQVVEMAVCMANGGGGTVVFGVADRVKSRAEAILGVPPDVETPKLIAAIYNSTDPKITAAFEELTVQEGTGRLLVMHVFGGLAPYTDTNGAGKIRQGKECMPLTGTLRARVMVEAGETDYTAVTVEGLPENLLSPAAMEQLRDLAQKERGPQDLLERTDLDLLATLGAIRDGRLTRAGVFLGGRDAAVKQHFPGFVWTHLRMRSDTAYSDRMDESEALPGAMIRLMDRIMADNPITTVEHGLFHFEYRTYPELALREALMNALTHQEFRLRSPVMVKQFAERLEISNGGGFIGGVTAENILHHPPVPRNPLLVDALARLRLVNRSNLGISRMYELMLIEGKAPPFIGEAGESVRVAFLRQDLSPEFRFFVADESKAGRILRVDKLIVLQYLLSHREIDTATAARLCQRREDEMIVVLDDMVRSCGYLERGGTGRGTYWTMAPALHRRLAGPGHPERDRRIDWEAAKTRVLSVLMERARRQEPGMTNAEVRAMTQFDRQQVNRLIHELEPEGVQMSGHGAASRYAYGGTQGKLSDE